jgi:hypothetical protein
MENLLGPHFSRGLTLTEEEILADPHVLAHLQSLLYRRQFSMPFLATSVEWYDSWVCLRTQKGLTPQFCFRYLFDNGTDSADNWTDFNDIVRYFGTTLDLTVIEKAFEEELEYRSSL